MKEQKIVRMTSTARFNKNDAEQGMARAMREAAADFSRIILAERAFALKAVEKAGVYEVEIIAHLLMPERPVEKGR
ncbi:MAG TPA: hypothetical protein PKY99_00105 [Turneriella sp.]|nr:hypothetical protein [Turneriella sp.]